MSTAPDTPLRRWLGFWFHPADPTTLGFMRVVVGCLILYIHGAYSLDLQAFFGKHGWYGLKEVERERKEAPNLLTAMFGPDAWEEFVPSARTPMYPHRRQAVMRFIRSVSPDPATARSQLAYLIRLQNFAAGASPDNSPTDLLPLTTTAEPRLDRAQGTLEGLRYLGQLYSAESDRRPQLDALVNKSLRTARDYVTPPRFIDELPDSGPNSRPAVRAEIEALLGVLPKDSTQRKYVIDHLIESVTANRHAFLRFLLDLPADAAEREKKIEYLEYWNTEERKAFRVGNNTFSIWFHISDPTEMAVAHGLVLVVMVMFTLGLFTRVTAVLTWLLAIGYIHRTQQVLFGMDTMMNILLIYLMVGNSGAAVSLDRLFARHRAARNSLRRTGTIDAATAQFLAVPPPSVSAGFALRLTQVHFAIIYLAAGLSKLKGPAWWNTNAFWDTMGNPEFTLIHFQWYESLLRWMMSERLVYSVIASGGVLFTLIMEIGLPFLVWTKLRPYMIIGAVLLHFGISVFMGLNLFGLLMLSLLLSYFPAAAIRSVWRSADAVKVKLTYDPSSEAQLSAAARVVAVDVDQQVEVIPAAGAYTVTVAGNTTTGPAAAAVLAAKLSLLSSFRWLPFGKARLAA